MCVDAEGSSRPPALQPSKQCSEVFITFLLLQGWLKRKWPADPVAMVFKILDQYSSKTATSVYSGGCQEYQVELQTTFRSVYA